MSDAPGHVPSSKNVESHTPEQQEQVEIESPTVLPAIARQATRNPQALTPADVTRLQRTIGNQGVLRLLAKAQPDAPAKPAIQRDHIPAHIQRALTSSEEIQLRSVMDQEYAAAGIPARMIIVIHQNLSRAPGFLAARQVWEEFIAIPHIGANLTATYSFFTENTDLKKLMFIVNHVSSANVVITSAIMGGVVLTELVKNFAIKDAASFIGVAQQHAQNEQDALAFLPLYKKLNDVAKFNALIQNITPQLLPTVSDVVLALLDSNGYDSVRDLTQYTPLDAILATADRAKIVLGFLPTYTGNKATAVTFALANFNDDNQRLTDLFTLLTSYPDRQQDITETFPIGTPLADAQEEMRLRALYEFNQSFLTLGKDIGEQVGEDTTEGLKSQAETDYRQTEKELKTQAGSDRSWNRIKGMGKERGKKLSKTEEGIKTSLGVAKNTKDQAITNAPGQGEQAKENTIENIGNFVQTNKGQMDVGLLKQLIERTRQDTALATSLKDVMLRQQVKDDFTLVDNILGSTVKPLQTLITTCLDLLQRMKEIKCWAIAEFIATCTVPDANNWLEAEAAKLTVSFGDLQDHVKFLTKHKTNMKKALIILETIGENGLHYGEDVPLLSLKEGDLRGLLALDGTPGFQFLKNYVVDKPKEVSDFLTLWAYNTAHQQYPLEDVVDWMRYPQKNAAKVLEALQTTQPWGTLVKLVENYLAYDATPNSSEQFLFLVRLDAIARSPGGLALTAYQADVRYVGSHNPPSRTGFLQYTFTNNDRAEIHTHWNKNQKKLDSMHIQDANGANGIEINQWNFFKKVQEAVRDSHNASVNFPPTTTPPGGQLSL
jgi:hypothetical protein